MSPMLKKTPNKKHNRSDLVRRYRGALSTGFELVAEAAGCQWMNEPFGS
jgi:hypothetical protein